MSPEAQGWCPCLAVASVYLIQSMVTDRGPSRGCMQRTKPVHLLWFIVTCLKTPGKCDDSGVTSCHYIFTDESKKAVFSCHSTDSHRGKEWVEGQKQRHKEITTFEVGN